LRHGDKKEILRCAQDDIGEGLGMTDEVKAPLRRARLLAAAWGCFLLAVTSWPNPPSILPGGFPLDKVTHLGLYAVEAFLLYRAIGWQGPSGFRLSRIIAIVGTMALWGMLDETHQEWIPGRMMDSGDLIADIAGAAAGTFAAAFSSERPRKRLNEG
jgi:VanZ family protein